ncbi:MAG: 50S ribosomal protein L20 [Acidobacteriota bacterium]|jgi:large subunit ribosomal protein L20
MPRVRRGHHKVERRKKLKGIAKGYFGAKSRLYRSVKEQVERSLVFAFAGRKVKKIDFRRLWIVRINAGCRQNGISYSRFMDGLKKAGLNLDRKSLAGVALTDPQAFASLVERAKKAIA